MENMKPKLVPRFYYIPIIYVQFEGFFSFLLLLFVEERATPCP